MKTIIFGAAGQLGTDLRQQLSGEVLGLSHQEMDICNESQVAQVLQQHQPDVVINTAAYNKVDLAEDEPQEAYRVNALGPRNLAKYCEINGIACVQISTDYVFGIEQERHIPYGEYDLPGPLSAYGVSKLAGEYYVANLAPRSFIIRTCGLYGHAGKDGNGNFVETMLKLAKSNQSLKIVQDQICTPTSTASLAAAIKNLLKTEEWGLYHFTNSGITSWHDFAAEIFYLAGIDIELVPITTEEFGAKAARPAYSLLDCSKFMHTVGESIPAWQEALANYLKTRQ